jgi:NAD(P)H-nitrite reductase large subunit
MAEHFVVIGNGPAANEAVIALRERNKKVRITMIGRESRGYYRPDLLPRYVSGKLDVQDVYVQPFVHYGDLDIQLRLGQEVIQADFVHQVLTLDHKELVYYDGLIIAAGSVSRIPKPLQTHDNILLKLKTVEDANRWKDCLPRVNTVALAGGDVTSLAFSKELMDLGKQVTFVLDDSCFWPLGCEGTHREDLIKRLEGRGVQVVDGRKVNGITKIGDHEYKLDTAGGGVRAGLIGAFFGLKPNVGFLANSGLQIEQGILVDETLQTSFEGVYAAGDCAQVYSHELGDYWVSIGYGNAKNLGRVAAMNLSGGRVEAKTVKNSIFEVEGISVNNAWWTEF